jgi:hypothetical protein
MMLALGLLYVAFIILRYIPSTPSFIRAFIVKGYWMLLKDFSPSIEITKCFLSLLLLICCIIFNDMHMSNHPYISGMKLTWSWWIIFLICCWIQFAIIVLRIFASMFIKEIGL